MENTGRFLDTTTRAMAELKFGISKWGKAEQTCKDGSVKTVFAAFNAMGQKVMQGLVSQAIAETGTLPKDACISTIEYESDGELKHCLMLHNSNNSLTFSDFAEEE